MSGSGYAGPGSAPFRFAPDHFPAWPPPSAEVVEALAETVRAGRWWQSGGGRAERFEAWLANHLQVSHAVAVANGTVALELALRALGVGPGDEVLVPALTFISTASAVSMVGATPVPVDVERGSLCLSASDARRRCTPRTAAVVAVHLAGHPANMDEIGALARERSLAVVEDAAQALGAEWRGRPVGSLGDAATFSFHATKLLPGGEGGAVATRDGGLAERVRLLANCGRERGSRTYDHLVVGTNARMSEFHAAILLAGTSGLEDRWRVRDATADAIGRRLRDGDRVEAPRGSAQVTRMAWYSYCVRGRETIQGDDRNTNVASTLERVGLPATPMYPPVHLLPAYRDDPATSRPSCPEAESAGREVVCLPHRVLLAGAEVAEEVAQAIASAFED